MEKVDKVMYNNVIGGGPIDKWGAQLIPKEGARVITKEGARLINEDLDSFQNRSPTD